jgi:hypothetical protein
MSKLTDEELGRRNKLAEKIMLKIVRSGSWKDTVFITDASHWIATQMIRKGKIND